MKALILLAATGLGTLVALPHLPDMTTIANEIQTAFATVSTQLSQVSQPAQPGQTDQTAPSTPASQDGSAPGNPASTSPESPFVAQASPEDVRHTYGEPEHVERSVYGEVWYYPVYIIYFRNGFVHRVHRSTSMISSSSTATMPIAPFKSTGVISNGTITSLAPRTTSESWRFSTNSPLGTVRLGEAGVQRTSNFVPRQTYGEPNATRPTYPGSTYSNYRSGSSYHSGSSVSATGSSSTSTCNRPPTTSTATAPHPVAVQRSASVTTAPVYSRVGN